MHIYRLYWCIEKAIENLRKKDLRKQLSIITIQLETCEKAMKSDLYLYNIQEICK